MHYGANKLGIRRLVLIRCLEVGQSAAAYDLRMSTEGNSLNWELRHIRDAIASDWHALASGKLGAYQRKSVRDHLNMNLAALREVKLRTRIASPSESMRRLLGE